MTSKESNSSSPPLVPKTGASYGFLGDIAGWLINTEDIAFVLIIGLIGFGLLGATGSQLIIGIKDVKSNKLLIKNIYAAIVKGTTAALVVFLAIEGGMAIVNSGDSQNINPYSLFFICFIAAVYSSDVWDWAKKKLTEGIGLNKEGKQHEEKH